MCPDCGKERYVDVYNYKKIKTGLCKRCTALRIKESNIKYRSMPQPHKRRWLNRLYAMKSRCYKEGCTGYGRYGGRGIRVCREWLEDHDSFLAYIMTLDGWDNPDLEIDRIDNDGNYEPGNVRCVTRSENEQNTSQAHKVVYNGEVLCAREFWKKYASKYKREATVARLLREGKSPEQILENMKTALKGDYKKHEHIKFVDYLGEHLTVDEFWKKHCPEYKKKSNLQQRLDRGDAPESIIQHIRTYGLRDKRRRGRRYNKLRGEQ